MKNSSGVVKKKLILRKRKTPDPITEFLRKEGFCDVPTRGEFRKIINMYINRNSLQNDQSKSIINIDLTLSKLLESDLTELDIFELHKKLLQKSCIM